MFKVAMMSLDIKQQDYNSYLYSNASKYVTCHLLHMFEL